MTFQSTRPARGATVLQYLPHELVGFQSTRPARGATPVLVTETVRDDISIHAPREGRDVSMSGIHLFSVNISIHAPREGRDIVDASEVLRNV